MIFIDPSIEEIFNTLTRNNELIEFLNSEGLLITKEKLHEDYSDEEIKKLLPSMYVSNVNTMYDVAEVLYKFSSDIKANEIWYLASNKVAFNELATAFGVLREDFTMEAYKRLMFTYKYCVVSSFFQNNRSSFIPESDFYEIEKNPAAKGFFDAMMKEFDKLDYVISECNKFTNFDDIPYEYINYLTQLLGFEKSDILADETNELIFRELAKSILDIYKIKGTNYSFELFFNFLGFNIKIEEFFFDRRLYYSDLGNTETNNVNKTSYEYYLSTSNPIDNCLVEEININETVLPSDITPQYSLHEFNELCNKYGPEAVLGYSPVYPVYENGVVVRYEEYKEKVYKYFRTNAIYYTISSDKGNPTDQQIMMITKCLDFLTPAYVMKSINVNVYTANQEEAIAFDGDGSNKPDVYGNFNSFQMLDDEDWDQNFADEYVINKNGANITVDGTYNNKVENYKQYTNSLGTNTFRLPLSHKTAVISANKYLNNSVGITRPDYSRLKYYIIYTVNGKRVPDYTAGQDVVIAPYFTIPPFVNSFTTLNGIKNRWEKNTEEIDLPEIKEQVRLANLVTDIDYTITEPLEDFLESDNEFNELSYAPTFANYLTLVRTINYGDAKYNNAYSAYMYEINQRHIPVSNINISFNDFYDGSEEVPAEFDPVNVIYIENYYKNGLIEKLNVGDNILAIDTANHKLFLYRYAPAKKPILQDKVITDDFSSNYRKYLKSFNYKLVKQDIDYTKVVLKADMTCDTISKLRNEIDKKRDNMINATLTVNNMVDMDAIINGLYMVTTGSEAGYYRAIKIPEGVGICSKIYPSGRNHVFASLDEAETYFENNPNEKINNAEFYVTSTANKGLYTFGYNNREVGQLIYSIADEKLYTVQNKLQIFPIDNFYGKLTINRYSEENGELVEDPNGDIYKSSINDYDRYWLGYDEQADHDDFIFYNSEHIVTWKAAKLENQKISRPVKSITDAKFEEDALRIQETYTEESNPDEFDEQDKYFITIGQSIVDEITSKTANNFTDKEKINWAVENNQRIGIISIIEENMEELDLAGIHNEGFEFYSSISDFFNDYYRIIIMGNHNLNSIPENIKKAMGFEDRTEEFDVNNADDAEILESIEEAYNNAIVQIGNSLDDISKDRVYYAMVDNWENIIGEPGEWDGLEEIENKKEYIYSNPLDLSIAPTGSRNINGKYYFVARNNFIRKIYNAINSLKKIYGEYIKFNVSEDNLSKDCYSLNGRFESFDEFNYEYLNGAQTLNININGEEGSINTPFYLTHDSLHNFYVAYGLNYGLNTYSKDEYGEHRDMYSEFTELFDMFNDYATNKTEETKTEINEYIKEYYYKKLVTLYREACINDEYPVNIETKGKKPINIYPKLTEKLDGRAGTFQSPSTLLSSYYNNGGSNDTPIKLKFFKVSITDNEAISANGNDIIPASEVTIKLYVRREDFTAAYGYDYCRYYKAIAIQGTTNKVALSEAIDDMYKKQFACISPKFFFKERTNGETTNWKKYRGKYEVDFSSATARLLDDKYQPITNNIGELLKVENGNLVYDMDGNPIVLEGGSREKLERLSQGTIIEITITDKNIIQGVKLNGNHLLPSDEASNINGYIKVKKLTQKLIDNYVSKPISVDWIERDDENNPTEYISFGDDRSVDITSINKVIQSQEDFDNYMTKEYYSTTDKLHDEEVLEFNNEGKVAIIEDGQKKYVELSKTKEAKYKSTIPLEDQGHQPVYVTVPNNPVMISKDIKDQIVTLEEGTDTSDPIYINKNDTEIYYNNEGDLILSVKPGIVHTSNIRSIRLIFKVVYVIVKKSFMRFKSFINQVAVMCAPILAYYSKVYNSIISKIYAYIRTNIFLESYDRDFDLQINKIDHRINIERKNYLLTGLISALEEIKYLTLLSNKNIKSKFKIVTNYISFLPNTASKTIGSFIISVKNSKVSRIRTLIKKHTKSFVCSINKLTIAKILYKVSTTKKIKPISKLKMINIFSRAISSMKEINFSAPSFKSDNYSIRFNAPVSYYNNVVVSYYNNVVVRNTITSVFVEDFIYFIEETGIELATEPM